MADLSASFLVKLSPEELTHLDEMRGESGRSTWVRELVAGAARARQLYGGPCHIYCTAKEPLAPEPTPIRPEAS